MNEKRIALILMLLSLVGMAVCAYLTNVHQQIMMGSLNEPSLCSLNAEFNCDLVSASPYSSWWGIPVSWLGGMLYLLWFLLALGTFLNTTKNAATAFSIIFITASLAVVIDMYFAWVMFTIIGSICLFCLLSYGLNITACLLGFYLYKKQGYDLKRAILSIMPFSAHTSYGFASVFVLVAAIAFVGQFELQEAVHAKLELKKAALAQLKAKQEKTHSKSDFDEKAFKAFQSTAPRIAIDTASDPFMGNADALLTIVEFSDFQCPMCRQVHETLKKVLPKFNDRVKFVFKNMPLDKSCNSMMQRDLHLSACDLARLGEAAHAQGQFWAMQDMIFAQQDSFKHSKVEQEALWQMGQQAGLNMTQLKQDFPMQEQAIQRDIAAAKAAQVQGTPAFYFNGLAIKGALSADVLEKIIVLELQAAKEKRLAL
ncbi:MAG: thioredoxin domain-containing protein [Mariprofundaceae bacterium]|nr:thioredoxin domain-containing protein [Mariprofundaceae bacterium]